jgi:hypothetical protein
MTVLLCPLFNPDNAQIDSDGDPRSGAKLFTYLAGGSTKVTTYQDSAGTVAHRNPILLNANGLPPAPIWLTTGSTYKFVLAPSTDTDPPVSAILTIDNVSAINDTSPAAAQSEWIASGMTPTYVSATSFTVAGDQTAILLSGRRLKTTNNGGTIYATIIRSVYSSVTTVTVLTDSGSLDSGLSAVSYGICGPNNISFPFLSFDQQCGRLGYVSATSIRLDPQDGNTIWVYNGSNWRRRIIPSAGISLANTGLVANTLYYVYLFLDGSNTLTLEASTTVPVVDATSGLKIKTGDATRLLVGMVRTQGSTPGQFQTSGLTISWYKRRAIKRSSELGSNDSTGSASYVEMSSSMRVEFVTWAEEAVSAQFTGWALMDNTLIGHYTKITRNGTVTDFSPEILCGCYVANAQDNVSCAGHASLTEGYHYLTIAHKVSSGNGTWAAGAILYAVVQG